MKRKFVLPISLITVAVVLLVVVLIWWKGAIGSPSSLETKKRFLIDKGDSATQVGIGLQKEGLIKSALAFKFYMQVTDKTKSLPIGEFNLASNLTLYQLVDQLIRGPDELWVTIPEGLRREELPDRLISALGINSAQAESFRREFLDVSKQYEGKLFPDTYLFPPDVTAEYIVNKLVRTYESKFREIKVTNSYLTEDQIIVLASLIERETKFDEEKVEVAGIYINRLNADWPLQADAAVQYAVANSKLKTKDSSLENWWSILTKDDLELNSPFNTYKFTGLPPSPIASPGYSALAAAANPSKSNYWFYIHDASGMIHYAKTVAEHNQNVRTYLGK